MKRAYEIYFVCGFGYMDYKTFYEELISFNDYIEFRIMDLKSKKMFSVYARNWEEVEKVFEKYDRTPFNVYFGINTRKNRVRRSVDIEFRRFFYFDIEKQGEKPELTNKEYKEDLFKTTGFIISNLFDEYKIKPCALVWSGRGCHLYYNIVPLEQEFDLKFKQWYKHTQLRLDKIKPVKSIKFLDAMFDRGRIAGAPGTHHNKHPEKPLRTIEYMTTNNVFDIKPILNNFTPIKRYKRKKVKVKNRKWNDKNVFESPEFKVFELQIPAYKGYEINNKLLFTFKLLLDEFNIQNREEVQERFFGLGYWIEDFSPIESSEYEYSEQVLNNWVLKHWEFCLEKSFLVPYPFYKSKSYKYRMKTNNFVDDRDIVLNNPFEIMDYVKWWNNRFYRNLNGVEFFFVKDMKKNVLNKIKDERLLEWVRVNNFLDKIKLLK